MLIDNVRLLMTFCPGSFDLESVLFPNCSTFAVKCNCNSKISQKIIKLFLFEKVDTFFEKKFEAFQNCWRWQICCRICIKWYNILKSSSPLYLRSFLRRNIRNFENWENWKNWWRVRFAKKKTFFSYKRAFLLEVEGVKTASCSWLFCVVCVSEIKQI